MKKIFTLALFAGLFTACVQNTDTADVTIQTASLLPVATHSTPAATDTTQDLWLESLITATPQEGRELAIKMARKTIGAIQSDSEVKKRLRKQYAEDPELLILSAEVVAIEFRTVAEANNYWRK